MQMHAFSEIFLNIYTRQGHAVKDLEHSNTIKMIPMRFFAFTKLPNINGFLSHFGYKGRVLRKRQHRFWNCQCTKAMPED